MINLVFPNTKADRMLLPFNQTETMELATKLVTEMRDRKLMSLTAPEIGIPYQVLAIDGEPAHVFFNPKIVQTFKESYKLETSPHFPGLQIKIKRPEIVELRFTTADQYTTTKKFVGVSARQIQHSMLHLEGQDFRDDATFYHREQANKKLKLNKRRGLV